jgi:hypothetical protein
MAALPPLRYQIPWLSEVTPKIEISLRRLVAVVTTMMMIFMGGIVKL